MDALKIALLLALVYFAFFLTVPLNYDSHFYVSSDYEDYSARLGVLNASLNYTVPLASREYYENYPPIVPNITRFAYSILGGFGFRIVCVLLCVLLPFLALRQFGDAPALAFVALSGVPMLFLSFTTLAQACVTVTAINFYGAYHRLESWKWKAAAIVWYGSFAWAIHSTGVILIGLVFALIEFKHFLKKRNIYPAMIYNFGAYRVVSTTILTAIIAGLIPIYCAFKGKKHRIFAAFLLLSIVGAAYDIRVAWTGYVLACINAPKELLKWHCLSLMILGNLALQLIFGWMIA